MSGIKWSEDQNKAITYDNCNLLVSASAGSGKTAVLVERILTKISNIENPTNIDELLIVTFTKAAAAEMRERLAKALNKKIVSCYDDKTLVKHLKKQLMLLPISNISTIDSFCLEIVKKNFSELGLDPSFSNGDGMRLDVLKNEALTDVVESYLLKYFEHKKYQTEDETSIIDLIKICGRKSEEGLKAIILSCYTFLESLPNSEAWFDDAANVLNSTVNKSKWFVYYINEILESLYFCRACAKHAYNLVKYEQFKCAAIFKSELESIQMAVDVAESICNGNDEYVFNDLKDSIFNINFQTFYRKDIEDEQIKETVYKLRNTYKNEIDKRLIDYFDTDVEEIELQNKLTLKLLSLLKEIVFEFSNKYMELKRKNNIFSFSDIEHFCLSLLVKYENGKYHFTHLANELKNKYKEVLVDEYQDSNRVQELLLTAVSKQPENNNYFMVGDIKQSIYRFRKAEPKLFIDKYNSFDKYKKTENSLVVLKQNFRSRREIIDAVNSIFENVMIEKVGSIDYENEGKLVFGNLSYDEIGFGEGETPKCAELHVIDINEKDDASIEAEEYKVVAEARQIISIIKEKIKPNSPNAIKVIGKDNQLRRAKYSDITILMRAPKSRAATFCAEFEHAGLPIFSEYGENYYDTTEIAAITNLLKAINNPLDDYALVATLRSSWFAFDVNDLAEIRILSKDCPFYEAVQIAQTNTNLNSNQKVANFMSVFSEWRRRIKFTSISSFLLELYDETGYYNFVGNLPRGASRKANLTMLYNLAVEFEKTFSSNLYEFLNYISNLKESAEDTSEVKLVAEEDDVIRLMSIHKSKGLEFPILFVCSLGNTFNNADSKAPMIFDTEYGFGTKLVDEEKFIIFSSKLRKCIDVKIKRESCSEEMRVLYVALTRAKERLFLVGCVKDFEKLEQETKQDYLLCSDFPDVKPKILLNYNSYLKWIKFAMQSLKAKGAIEEYLHNVTDDKFSDNSNSLLNHNDDIQLFDENVDQSLIEKFKNDLDWKYKYDSEINAKYRYSVTELIKLSSNELDTSEEFILPKFNSNNKSQSELARPKFISNSNQMSAAEIGTVYHRIIRALPMTLIESASVEDFLENLVLQNTISKNQKDAVNVELLKKFICSPISDLYKCATKFEKEKEFHCLIQDEKLGEVLVQGVVDLYLIVDNKIVLVDYKSNNVTTENINELNAYYAKQMKYYKLALEQITGLEVASIYLYYIRIGEFVSI